MSTPDKMHPTSVTVTSGEELGRQIMRLRYDELQKVLTGMREECSRQMHADRERGRTGLFGHLRHLLAHLASAQERTAKIVKLCRPYIEKEKNVQETQ